MDRQSTLRILAESLEVPLWSLVEQFKGTLRGLAQTEHFDLDDRAAVGNALHSALPSAFDASGLGLDGFNLIKDVVGPGNKIETKVQVGGQEHSVCLELHFAGPRGGTRKKTHQYASEDVTDEPRFDGFDVIAPQKVLLFLAYHLNGISTAVERLHLVFSDGVDRRSIQLFKPDEIDVRKAAPIQPQILPEVGAALRIREHALGEANTHARKANKRRNAAPSS
ncbi:hypothetical protein [Thalassospira sp. GB04J01]|uniref:hypothetical protein n=1 Tax=Thalassospira sp. GB04J01 TaxID=1485225 RepID=UPI0011AF30FA|nr:hypothetical protein [Thalassospira sp. GB04J01]